ncbi:MAG: hypothetical protein ACT4PJ_18405 [Gemmatimonadaceae bacterium]
MLATRRFASLFAVAVAAVVLTSCADDSAPPTAPVAQVTPEPSLIGDLLGTTTNTVGDLANSLSLVSCNVTKTHRASAEIGPEGGTLKIGPHHLVIPPKALRKTVRIRAEAPKGEYVQIEFEPQGLEFRRSTSLTMSYAECSLLSPLSLKIVYVNDQLEILEVLPTLVNLLTQSATAPVDHFSRYMLAD